MWTPAEHGGDGPDSLHGDCPQRFCAVRLNQSHAGPERRAVRHQERRENRVGNKVVRDLLDRVCEVGTY